MVNDKISSVQELVAAREARGLTPDDIQRQLKLHARQVAALEAGDWAALPGIPFVRGTLRNYAKVVGVDVEPLLESVGGHSKPADLRPSASLEAPLRDNGMLGFGNGGSGSRWTWAVLMIAGVAALALFFGRPDDGGHVPSWLGGQESPGKAGDGAPAVRSPGASVESVAIAPAAGTSGSTTANPATPAADARPAEGGATSSAGPATASESSVPAAVAAATPAASVPPSGNAPAARDGTALRLMYDAESWVEVKQADGKVLLLGTQKAQSASDLTVKGPVSLIIGNAAKVKLEYDGKPVPLKVAQGTGIARVKLP
jgi:cytoskeleton protein RodZ